MAGLPKSIVKKYGISKAAWRAYRAGKAKKSNPPKKVTKTAKRKGGRRAKARKYGRRALFGPELNYVLGCAGSFVGEELEVNQIRPRVEAMTGARTQMNVGLEGGVDLLLGFAANYVGNRIPQGRTFLKGLAYTIGGKGIGKVKHAITGKPGLFGG